MQWKPLDAMPEARLPKHVRILAAMLSSTEKDGLTERRFTDREAVPLISRSGGCSSIRNWSHELATLCEKVLPGTSTPVMTKNGLGVFHLNTTNARTYLEQFTEPY